MDIFSKRPCYVNGVRCSRSGDRYNHFHSVAERRVEQSPPHRADFCRELLGGEGEDRGEGEHGQEVEDEDGGRTPAEFSGGDAKRHAEEQEVGIAVREGGRKCAPSLLSDALHGIRRRGLGLVGMALLRPRAIKQVSGLGGQIGVSHE